MVYLATILLASILVQSSAPSPTWNDPNSDQYHIQTDEGPERYFRYQTQNGQYRKEKRLEDGTVIGTYAWIDDDGFLRQRDYIADGQGYRITKNKNIFVGRNVNVGDAVKAAKKQQNSYASSKKGNTATNIPFRGYIPAAFKTVYPSQNIKPSVDVSLNSIPSSTAQPPLLPSATLSTPLPTNDVVSGYISSTQSPLEVYVGSSTPSSISSTHLVSGDSTINFIPTSTPNQLSSSSFRPTTTLEPPRELSVQDNYSDLHHSEPSNVYIPSSRRTVPPYISTYYVPKIASPAYIPPSQSYVPSSTPRPFEIQSTTHVPPSLVPESVTPPSVYLPSSTYSPIYYSTPSTPQKTPEEYIPPSSPEYISITPPPKKFYSQNSYIDSNLLEYSDSSNQNQFVNPYIHQNGPTYPLDTKGHSFNPTYNNIGNGYDPQYPYYDGISVTNDGFRYYIPRAYHEEQNESPNRKSGSFGYIDPFGIRRVIYYNAGPDGFKHRKNNRYVGFNATPYDPRPY